MRRRARFFLTRMVTRVSILGLLASLMALAPLGPLTQAAHAATGTINEYRPAGIMQNSSSDLLGIAAGPDGNIWFTDAGEDLSPFGGQPAPPKQIGRFNPATQALDLYPTGEIGSVPTAITVGPDGNLWYSNHGAAAN